MSPYQSILISAVLGVPAVRHSGQTSPLRRGLWLLIALCGTVGAEEPEGELARTIAEVDRAIAAHPDDYELRAERAALHLEAGDYDAGAADLKAAIARHPGDAGQGYSTATSGLHQGPLTEDELAHGERQLRAMLRDRPAMGRGLTEGDPLWQFAVRRFGGEALGKPIDWDPQLPSDSLAEHVAPHQGRRGRIRVTTLDADIADAHPDWAFERLWSLAVFELHNMSVVPVFDRLRQQATAGTISKVEFVAGIFAAEHEAIERTRGFYVHVFLPYAAKRKLPTDLDNWFGHWWVDPDKVFGQFADRTTYPWRPYARLYDWHRVPVLVEQKRFDAALKQLERMLGEEIYAAERPEVFYWIARCHAKQGRPDEAREALEKALRLDPDHAGARAMLEKGVE